MVDRAISFFLLFAVIYFCVYVAVFLFIEFKKYRIQKLCEKRRKERAIEAEKKVKTLGEAMYKRLGVSCGDENVDAPWESLSLFQKQLFESAASLSSHGKKILEEVEESKGKSLVAKIVTFFCK